MRVFMYVYIHVCIYTYTYAHIHVYIYIYMWATQKDPKTSLGTQTHAKPKLFNISKLLLWASFVSPWTDWGAHIAPRHHQRPSQAAARIAQGHLKLQMWKKHAPGIRPNSHRTSLGHPRICFVSPQARQEGPDSPGSPEYHPKDLQRPSKTSNINHFSEKARWRICA